MLQRSSTVTFYRFNDENNKKQIAVIRCRCDKTGKLCLIRVRLGSKKTGPKKSVAKKESGSKSLRPVEKRPSSKSAEELRRKPSKSEEKTQNAKLKSISEIDDKRRASDSKVRFGAKGSQSSRKSSLVVRHRSLNALTDATSSSAKTNKRFASEPRLSQPQRLRHWSPASLSLASAQSEAQCKKNEAIDTRIG